MWIGWSMLYHQVMSYSPTLPSRQTTFLLEIMSILIYGNGDRRCIWVDETDVATYTTLAIDDPRTLKKILHIHPRANILTQMELVQISEKPIGKVLKKTFINENQYFSL